MSEIRIIIRQKQDTFEKRNVKIKKKKKQEFLLTIKLLNERITNVKNRDTFVSISTFEI